MPDAVVLGGRLLALSAAGVVYVAVLGAALTPWILPVAWRPYRSLASPFVGWAALVAAAYPLNASLPGRPVLIGLGAAALLTCVVRLLRRRSRPAPRVERWSWVAAMAGAVSLASPVSLYAGAGTLSTLVADSDVEHFADVIASLLTFPLGWSGEAQMGLEATPVGLAYHYVHAAISAITGLDTFSTAVPSHLSMAALAPAGVYLFSREALGAGQRAAGVAAALSAVGSFTLAVPAFGWGQQTAALATLPAGLAGVRRALVGGSGRDVLAGGLLAALASGSLYLATAPLVGGAAALSAALLIPSLGVTTVGRRAAGLGLTVLAVGALSHLSALSFFFVGGLSAGDVAGRASHVGEFASALQALGVEPITLFAVDQWPGTVLSALAGAAAATLAAAGLIGRRRDPLVLGTLLTTCGFALYLRVMRPFPYGEFKLLTSVWPLLPALALVGVDSLRRARPSLAPVWALCVTLYGGGLALTHWHVRGGLAVPWGAALPERELDTLRHVVSRVPTGAAVWVSNQLVPDAAVRWEGIETTARHGFASREAGAGYLARRWRGAATSLLALSGRPAYGLVQRHSTELRAQAEPHAADFILLDATEDPLFLGLTERALVLASGRLRLYRAAGGPLPRAPLPVGESLPGRRQEFSIARFPPPGQPQLGPRYHAHALWAGAETEVRLLTPGGERLVALFPGLTWLVTPHVELILAATGDTEARPLGRQTLAPGAWTAGEQLVRSTAGRLAPAVLISETSVGRELRYVNLAARPVSTAARPRRSEKVWLNGRAAGPQISLDPPTSVALLTSDPGVASWLEVGPEGRAALHAPAGSGLFSLPLLSPAAERAPVENGILVKGSSARLHLALDGTLHWVPTLEALARLTPVPRLITLRDEELWRLPVGLPVD